jgi:uncharacterized phage protein (TIGR02220 family)
VQQKNSFILYLDQSELFGKLSDEQAGKLIKHAFSYASGNSGDHDDPLVDMAFTSIKQAMRRDMAKWEAQKKQRVEAGKKSAEKRSARANEEQRESTVVVSVEKASTNPTVSVSGSVSGSVSVSGSDKPSSKHLSRKHDVVVEIIDYLNAKTGKSFKPVDAHGKHIRGRLAEGHTIADLKAVVDRKTLEWKGTEQAQYLRPATLFNAEKFNQYIGEVDQPLPRHLGKGVETTAESVDRIKAQAQRIAANMEARQNG